MPSAILNRNAVRVLSSACGRLPFACRRKRDLTFPDDRTGNTGMQIRFMIRCGDRVVICMHVVSTAGASFMFSCDITVSTRECECTAFAFRCACNADHNTVSTSKCECAHLHSNVLAVLPAANMKLSFAVTGASEIPAMYTTTQSADLSANARRLDSKCSQCHGLQT